MVWLLSRDQLFTGNFDIDTAAEQSQELDSMMNKVTLERDRLLSQVKELRREMADRDSENSSFELRINQRNSQLVELQEQINEKAIEVTKLDRKVGSA